MTQSLGTFYSPRVGYLEQLKGSQDPSLQQIVLWAQKIVTAINLQTPAASYFSNTSPNSNLTAARGTIAININSNFSVHWVKQIGSGNTGWVAIA